MATVNLYLNFDGNCAEAFNFYKAAFGGEFSYIGKYKDMPKDTANPLPMSEADGEKIMHVTLPISPETCLMGCDLSGEWATHFKQGNNFTISINVDSKDEAIRLFNSPFGRGASDNALGQNLWSAYFGMFTDKFGINWMVDLGDK